MTSILGTIEKYHSKDSYLQLILGGARLPSLGPPLNPPTQKTLVQQYISQETWELTPLDRAKWRSTIYKVKGLKLARRTGLLKKSKDTKPAAKLVSEILWQTVPLIPCFHCHRSFRVRIGLVSHLRNHKQIYIPASFITTQGVFTDSTWYGRTTPENKFIILPQ